MHGYGVVVRLAEISRGVFPVNAGSMFVAFQRLHKAGLIKSDDRSRSGHSKPAQSDDRDTPTAPHVAMVNSLVEGDLIFGYSPVFGYGRESLPLTPGGVSMDLGQIVFIMSATKTSVRIL